MWRRAVLAMIALLTLGLAGAAAGSADGPGSCPKGKIWDADQQKCVPKPRGSGSHAG